MTEVTPSSGKLHFMKLDHEALTPNFFLFFLKSISSNLVQTFKSSVDVVGKKPSHLPHYVEGRTFQSKTTCPFSWNAHLQIICMDERAVHMQQTCVCVHMCAYVCLFSRVYVALQCQCAETSRNWKKKDQLFFSRFC